MHGSTEYVKRLLHSFKASRNEVHRQKNRCCTYCKQSYSRPCMSVWSEYVRKHPYCSTYSKQSPRAPKANFSVRNMVQKLKSSKSATSPPTQRTLSLGSRSYDILRNPFRHHSNAVRSPEKFVSPTMAIRALFRDPSQMRLEPSFGGSISISTPPNGFFCICLPNPKTVLPSCLKEGSGSRDVVH